MDILEKSYYYNKIKNNIHLVVWSLLISIFIVLISYPGIFYSDSYGRIDTADKLRVALGMFLSGQWSEIERIECWVTVIPSVFMAICRMITGNVATYTMLQCFSFYLVSFLLIKRIGTSFKWLQYLLLVVNPLFYTEAIYYEAGIGCVVGMMVVILMLTSNDHEKNLLDDIFEYVILIFASFVTFGYRANAITVLPVFVICVLIRNWNRIRKVVAMSAMIIGLLLVIFVPQILNVDTMGSSMAGFVWDMLTAINTMEPEHREQYIDYLDELAGEGSTASALDENSDYIVLSYMSSNLDAYALSADGATNIVLNKYIRFIINEPKVYYTTKWMFACKTLGISQPLYYEEYNYDLIERMWEWGFSDTIERLTFYRRYYKMIECLGGYILHPWIVFGVSIILVLVEWFRRSKNRMLYTVLLGTSIFYYGAFLINTQSFELRYFYPSLYIMWIMDLAILLNGVSIVNWKKFCGKISRKKERVAY